MLLTKRCPVWGQTGHRVLGEIAEKSFTRKSQKENREIIQRESLAFVLPMQMKLNQTTLQ